MKVRIYIKDAVKTDGMSLDEARVIARVGDATPTSRAARLLVGFADRPDYAAPKRLEGFALVDESDEFVEYDDEFCRCGLRLQQFAHRNTEPHDHSCVLHGCPEHDNTCEVCR